MNPMTMLQSASVLLILTAGGGVAMALQRLATKSNPPNWLAMTHGLLAASGLTLLTYAALHSVLPTPAIVGLVMVVTAAAGGVVMNLLYHLAGKLIPQWLLHLHIALAGAGTALVAWAAWAG